MNNEIDILNYFEEFLENQQRYIKNHYDPRWCSWFTGLVDGEGYFHLVKRHTERRFEVEFVINLRLDDKPVLVEIKNILGIGKLYDIDDEAQRNKGMKASDRARFRCCKIQEITHILIPLFEEYPLHSKKQRDYKIWREAAFLMFAKLHLTDKGFHNMMMLVEELKYVREDTPLNNHLFVHFLKKRILR